MRKNVIQGMLEASAYLAAAYIALPEHERQRLRMAAYRGAKEVSWQIAERFGWLALKMEAAYDRERAEVR